MAFQIVDINTITLFLDYAFQTILDRIIEIENTLIEADKSTDETADESTDKSTDKSTDLLIRDVVEHLLSLVCGPPIGWDALLQDVIDTSCTLGTPAEVDENGPRI
jgi:hypothetical protein